MLLATIVIPFGVDSRELEQVRPSIHPELREHTEHFRKKIYRISDNVYSAVGWGLANTIMIVGKDGLIIVDVGEDIGSARIVREELRKISDKPVKAVIYTHFHPDHINGVKAFVSEEQVRAGEAQIIAHQSLLDNVINQGDKIGPILGIRTAYTSGAVLDPGETEGMNLGIGPNPNVGGATFIAPTLVYDDRKRLTIAGIELELRHVPSEAPDETAVYLPESNILLSGETIQGPTLPNIHTLRGTKFRDPVSWYKSIDVLRSYQADHLVPSHGQPVSGKENVETVLRATRDGIQFIHDQTVRFMNQGLTPDELAEVVKLPPHLASVKPYLREYYGTVEHSVRQIYQGYLGWFQGDPVALDPVPRIESARRHVALMGGRDAVMQHAHDAHTDGDFQWAAELATYLIRIAHDDHEARNLKAACFRHLGYAQLNTNWRNWYLTSARELDGSLDIPAVQRRIRAALSSPDLMEALPIGKVIEGLSVRIDAEAVLNSEFTVAFELIDLGTVYALEVRRGVAQFHEGDGLDADVSLRTTRASLLSVLLGQTSLEQVRDSGEVDITGDAPALMKLLGALERPAPIYLTLR
ncbi:MAG: MBL fold metallo-hydrolase [Gammaproteobacteria bacterium]|nr:MBL fold metallo-hydrolase [Gammaproteobacteria bacterium]